MLSNTNTKHIFVCQCSVSDHFFSFCFVEIIIYRRFLHRTARHIGACWVARSDVKCFAFRLTFLCQNGKSAIPPKKDVETELEKSINSWKRRSVWKFDRFLLKLICLNCLPFFKTNFKLFPFFLLSLALSLPLARYHSFCVSANEKFSASLD